MDINYNILFNTEHWPVVYFKSGTININDENFDEYKKSYLQLLVRCKRNNQQMILICDLNSFNNDNDAFPIKYFIKQSNFNKEIYDFNKKYLKCVCILCKNKNIKTMLNLYFSVSRPAAPYKLCRSNEKANSYINEKGNINFNIGIFLKNNDTEDNEVDEEDSDEANINNDEYLEQFEDDNISKKINNIDLDNISL